MTASYSLFHVIPDTCKGDADGCASSNVNFRHTCLSPRYFWFACALGESVCCFFPPKRQAQLNGRSRGLYYTVEEGGGGGGVEGGRTASEVRDWHQTLILPVFMVTQRGVGTERGNQRYLSPILTLV